MHLSKLLWLLVLSLLISAPVGATGGGGQVEQRPGGVAAFEEEVYQLVFRVPANSFTNLIDRYLASPIGGNLGADHIGGFTFIPVRLHLDETNTLRPLHLEAEVSGPIPYRSYGYRVFLTYWEVDSLAPGKRRIKFFGLEGASSAFQPDPLPTSPNYFVLDKGFSAETFPNGNDQSFLRGVAEFELSYLPIEDYYYLTENTSYYPESQSDTLASANRQLVIQRAVVAQTFDIRSNEVDSIYQYRTLSFRPYPYPRWTNNEEAVVAFKYGYYCPPYWGEGQASASEAGEESPPTMLFFQQQSFGPETTNNMDSLLLLSLSRMLGGQLDSRADIVERFKPPITFAEIISRYWWGAVVVLILGFFLGRGTKNDSMFNNQNG